MSETRGSIIGGNSYHVWTDDKGIHFDSLWNPYSWSMSYFDDWRCVVDYLRACKR